MRLIYTVRLVHVDHLLAKDDLVVHHRVMQPRTHMPFSHCDGPLPTVSSRPWICRTYDLQLKPND